MKSRLTIAGASRRHNRLYRALQRLGPIGPARTLLLNLLLGSFVVGCASSGQPSAEVPVWELANAEPVKPTTLLRTRVNHERPLPEHLVQRLCDEFSLVVVTRRSDWTDLTKRFQPQPGLASVDLSAGAVVGILANVGECAGGAWPIELDAVRARDGEAWIEARFVGGLYYPLQTAGYLELAYVPGLREVRLVRVGHRTFIIGSRSASH